MKKFECIVIGKSVLCESPKLQTLVLLEAIFYDIVKELYYIDIDNPLSTLLLFRFPELAHANPRTITITIN